LTRSGWPLTMELAVVAPRGFQSPAMADWESSEAPIPVAVGPGPYAAKDRTAELLLGDVYREAQL
jgi:hypothetical protein